MADDALLILSDNVLQALREDATLAALVHATKADCADRAALRAITGQAESDIRLVDEGLDYGALYQFDADNAGVDNNGSIIEPTVGLGAWIRLTITALAWASSSEASGHVFKGILGKLFGGRNRGRMPLLEVDMDMTGGGISSDEITSSGGETNVPVIIRGWVINGTGEGGLQPLRTMLMRAVRAIRNAHYDTSNDYLTTGTTEQRLYRGSNFSGPEIKRYQGALYGDMTVNIKYTYTEDVLA